MFTKEQLKKQICEMGILPTDTVMMHTSLRAVGPVEGGADTVIDAFCEVLTEGLFLVPTHTWSNVHADQPVYDVTATVPCIGALPCAAAFRKDGVRSLHPTHSVWAHGKSAAAFVAGEESALTPASPHGLWARLAEAGAKILLVGVGNDKNTFIHAVDEIADLPDRLKDTPFEVTVRAVDGTEHKHPFYSHFCSRTNDVSRQFVNFEPAFNELGVQSFGTLGNATVRVVDAAKCRDTVLKIYAHADRDVCVEPMEIPAEWYRK